MDALEVGVSKKSRFTKEVLFSDEFGFVPVRGKGPLKTAQRNLERQIVALHLGELWRSLERCEVQLLHREPPSWLKKLETHRASNRKQLEESVGLLRTRYIDASKLAMAFNLHPEQPMKDE